RLGVSGDAGAHGFIGWVGVAPADVARHHLLNPSQALEHSLEAPETSAGQSSGLNCLRHDPPPDLACTWAVRPSYITSPQPLEGPSVQGARSVGRAYAFQLLEALHRLGLLQKPVSDPAGIEGTPLLMRKLVVIREELLDLPLDGHQEPDVARQEF